MPYTGLVQPDSENVNEELVPIKAESLDKALDGERPDLVEPPAADPEGAETLASLFGDLYEDTSFGTMKFVEGDQTYENHRELYDAVKDAVGSKEEDPLGCIVTVLATCDDAQTTPAGNPLSVFTFNLTQVWSRGGFAGSYSQFHKAVKDRSRPDVTPQINAYGGSWADARLRERPFAF